MPKPATPVTSAPTMVGTCGMRTPPASRVPGTASTTGLWESNICWEFGTPSTIRADTVPLMAADNTAAGGLPSPAAAMFAGEDFRLHTRGDHRQRGDLRKQPTRLLPGLRC